MAVRADGAGRRSVDGVGGGGAKPWPLHRSRGSGLSTDEAQETDFFWIPKPPACRTKAAIASSRSAASRWSTAASPAAASTST
jgi:hypothetical protein